MRTLKEINEDTILEDIRDLLKRFNESLILRVDPAGLTLKSTLPFKVLSLKELLFHRITDIATSALELYDQNKRVPSYILMRSAVETCALCFVLRKKCEGFIKSPDEDEFDNFLMRGITGGKMEKAKHESINVLTCIDHVDKEFNNFRNMYDVLCEYAHPNYLGTLDSYGKYERKCMARFKR